jgi:pseudouridine-5'-phosphate glycosidase
MIVRISPEVQQALQDHRPVVALESTIITHGMPYPRNVETAMSLERIIREEGAIPATIGIMRGEAVIGLSEAEIDELASLTSVVKVSRRDLPVVLSKKLHGGTTVAATMILAARAGISVFATGGIGGVHRGAATTMDISADLQELAQTPVIVVCSGAKAILDLPLTQEVLETLGVPVLGYRCDTWPSFYSRSSPLTVDARMEEPREIAEAWQAKKDLSLPGGMLIMNPIPEQEALDPHVVEAWIQEALKQAETKGIRGKATTPFLLAAVEQASQGRSLQANVALVQYNARIGAKIAVAISHQSRKKI